MRTVGTIKDIYEAAKGYFNNEDNEIEHCPMDPVVRYMGGGEYYLESGIHPEKDAIYEVTLDTFHDWFGSMYSTDAVATEEDRGSFDEAMWPEQEEEDDNE